MVFKKFDNQQVYQLEAKASVQIDAVVGDVISYVPSTQTAEKITKKSEAETALGAGKQLYLLAQSDAVTDKTGTAYKTYIIPRTITIGTDATTVVVGYRIDSIENVDGWEVEGD